MTGFSVRFDGLDKLSARLGKAAAQADKTVDRSLYKSAQRIMTAAKRVTPKDTGVLRASGAVEKEGAGWALGFGGAAAAYALYQHEAPGEWSYTTGGTGPKYLETPFVAGQDQALNEVSDAVRALLGGAL